MTTFGRGAGGPQHEDAPVDKALAKKKAAMVGEFAPEEGWISIASIWVGQAKHFSGFSLIQPTLCALKTLRHAMLFVIYVVTYVLGLLGQARHHQEP
eukprot:scaffold290730_cov32-Prasinocladus_malaysianus.AAC.1